jgi:hypothetical protein
VIHDHIVGELRNYGLDFRYGETTVADTRIIGVEYSRLEVRQYVVSTAL